MRLTQSEREMPLNTAQSHNRCLPMLTTGLFKILRVESNAGPHIDGSKGICSVSAECLKCCSVLSVRPGEGLEALQGGIVITCPSCRTRQAVSNELFVAED